MEWRVEPPKADGTARVYNLDLGVTPQWWESRPIYNSGKLDSGGTIVLKVPGASHWSGRGESRYQGTYFQVLKILRKDDKGNFVCEPIVDFPMRIK